MGVVYRAWQRSLKRIVALKMIRAGALVESESLKRFRREAEALARLQHPNIVQVYEIGECEGKPYFTLEYCAGGSLDDKLRAVPFAPRVAAVLVETLARAMQAAHGEKVIHRDLKPRNILFDDLFVFRGANQPDDPGFETPSVGTGTYDSFRYQPGGSPWTFDAGSGVAGNGSGFTDGNPNAPDGTQVAFLQGYGTASQSVTFAPGTYSISLSAAQRGNGNYSSQTFQVLVDGNVAGTFTPPDANYAAYATGSFSFTTGGAHTITVAGTDPDGGDNTVFIDGVQINQVVPVIGDAGFEVVNVGSGSGAYQYDPAGSAWTFTGGAGVSANNTDFTGGNPAAPEGNQMAFLQGTDAGISQSPSRRGPTASASAPPSGATATPAARASRSTWTAPWWAPSPPRASPTRRSLQTASP
jgi:hypothetical protein